MDFHSTYEKRTSISTQSNPTPFLMREQLASSASYLAKERKKERKEIANRVEAQSYEELQSILRRENKTFTKWLDEKIKEDVKVHGSGNPVYPLDNWTKNPEFIVIPALLAPRDQRKQWISIQAQKKNWGDLKDIKAACEEWLHNLKGVGI